MFDEHQYIVQIEKRRMLSGSEWITVGEVSFYRNDDDSDVAHSTQSDVNAPTKVYGVVFNAVSQKYKNDEFTALSFTAELKHSDTSRQFTAKKNIYYSLARRLVRSCGGMVYSNNTASQFYMIASKNKLEIRGFKNELKEAIEKLTIVSVD